MATVLWTGNAAAVAQIDSLQVTAVAASGTLSAIINTKPVTYTCTASDTVATAATNWLALLAASNYGEFTELSFTISPTSTSTILCTARNPGTPFTMTSSNAGGATVSHAVATANASPNDPGNANNWLRSGSNAIPQTGDDVVLQSSDVSILYNLTALGSVQINSFTRYQTYTGSIGLPYQNPNGYVEYRPLYFQLCSNVTQLPVILGVGSGSGPGYENIQVTTNGAPGTSNTALTVLGSGGVQFLSTSASTTLKICAAPLSMGMNPGEAGNFATATVYQGASLTLGPSITVATSVTVANSALTTLSIIPDIEATQGGATLLLQPNTGTFTTIKAYNGSTVTLNSGATITALTLRTSSTLDKSQDNRAATITNATIDGDTCVINDPLNLLTFSNPVVVNNSVNSGPFIYGNGRTVQLT